MNLQENASTEEERLPLNAMSKATSILFAFLLLSVHGATQSKSATTAAGSYRLRFAGELGLAQNLQLCGSSDTRLLRFYSESRWKPVAGSRLHLFLEHSASLDGDRSFLSVSLNYGIVRSLRLDDQNEHLTEVIIPLPPELITRENELVFAVTQFSRGSATGTPCTSIKVDSYIEIFYSEAESALDLSLFPVPFVDPHSYRTHRVSLLVPADGVSTPSLQALALVAARLARHAGARQLQFTLVRRIAAAEHPVIVIGTLEEQPELKELRAPKVVLQRGERRALAALDGERPLADSEGLAGVTMAAIGERQVPLLFVTANSSTGVLKATRQLLSGRITGAVTRVSEVSLPERRVHRQWAGFIPPYSRFRLADLTVQSAQSREPVHTGDLYYLDAPPDARFLEYGHEMRLAIQLAPGENPLPKLTVHLNGELIGQFVSRDLFAGSTASVTVEVPSRLLGTHNTLKFGWEGDPEKEAGPSVKLLPHSEFYLPRLYRAELPDLSLLQRNLYPFTLQPELEDLLLVIPDLSSVDSVALIAEIAGALGRLAPAETLDFQVRHAGKVSRAEAAGFNVIALIPEIGGNFVHKVLGNWQPLPWIDQLNGFPRIQQQRSPLNSQKWVLLIEAKSVPALQEAVRLCFSDKTLKQLRGDTAVLAGVTPISFTVVRKQTVEERLYFLRLEVWMREHWVALPIVLTLVSIVLFVALRVVLANYRRAQSASTSVPRAT